MSAADTSMSKDPVPRSGGRGERAESDPKLDPEALIGGMLQAVEHPMLIVDGDGLLRFANRAAVAALGYDRADELIGRPSDETIRSGWPGGFPDPASGTPRPRRRTTGETVTSELDWFLRRDGSMFPVSHVSVPLEMPGGDVTVVGFTDIEARRRAEQVLRDREAALASELASLRRVAALAAAGASSDEVFAAVAQEVAAVTHLPIVTLSRYDDDDAVLTVLGAWSDRPHVFQSGTRWPIDGPSMSAEVLRTGRPARFEDYANAPGTVAAGCRESGFAAVAGAPIIVDGEVWGVMASASPEAPIPEHVEHRLADYTTLIGTAISNRQTREDLRRLADEQAALRRVATLVAEGAQPAEVLAAVAREVGLVLGLPLVTIFRYEPDGTATAVGSMGEHPFHPGTNWPLDGSSLTAVVRRTGRAARLQDYADARGTIGEASRRAGFAAGVAAPIIVEGEVWGVVCACSDQRKPLSPDSESRLCHFTALVATAFSNTQAHEDLRRLADEQAALRRVATLVAEGAQPAEVFAAVAREVGQVLGLPLGAMFRYEPDGTATGVGSFGEHAFQPGTNWPLDGPSMTAVVRRTGRTARFEDYGHLPGTIAEASRRAGFKAGVAAPIVVDGEVWGVMCAGAADHPLAMPPDAERRLSAFTALVATAISNTQAREDLSRLATEQAALRRLATLVAEGAEAPVVFDAVCGETGRVLGASSVSLAHFTSDGFSVTMAGWSVRDVQVRAGARLPLHGDSVRSVVQRTAAPGRTRWEVGAPVVVEGRVWGALIAASDGPDALRAGTEHRLASFAELIATALSNAAARTELLDSRVRIVEAADEQRRRVVRDLHDGAQSHLVHAVIALERARTQGAVLPEAVPLVEEGLAHARTAISELRDLAHGIHPVILTNGGLAAAVDVLADRAPLPVEIEIGDERYPPAVESAAYFVAAEALTNVTKYARASRARIAVTSTPAALRLVVEDDGVGGAKRTPGGGLAGLGDRLAALDGVLSVDSPPGGGTRVRAEIPLPG